MTNTDKTADTDVLSPAPDGIEVVATAWKYHDRPCVDFKFAPDPYSMERGIITDVEPLVRRSQAQSALAAMRAAIETPEAVHANMLRGGIPKLSIRQALHLHGTEALEKWDRAETAEAQVKRLTEDNEGLRAGVEHVETLSELLKIIKEHWIDYDHVFSIAVDEADKFVSSQALSGSEKE